MPKFHEYYQNSTKKRFLWKNAENSRRFPRTYEKTRTIFGSPTLNLRATVSHPVGLVDKYFGPRKASVGQFLCYQYLDSLNLCKS